MGKMSSEEHSILLLQFLYELYKTWGRRCRSIYVELHKKHGEYIVLISYGGIDRSSEDLVDRVDVSRLIGSIYL